MHIVIDARIRRSSTGRYVDRLIEHLQRLDSTNTYTILISAEDDWKPQKKNFSAVTCPYPVFSFSLLNQILFSRMLYRLKPDLVHFAMTGHQPLFYFGRQITTTHDLTMFYFTRRGRLPSWLHWIRMRGYHLLVWSAHRRAQTIIVPSNYVRDAVAKYHLFTNRKIMVTYEASEPPLTTKPQPVEGINDCFVLYVGSAFPHKNLDTLIKSFELLLEKKPSCQLVLVGKQEQHAKRLMKWAQTLDYADRIVFTGFVSDEQLHWLYTNASAYVFPSLSEGFGLPGLEAMTYGCPVASSNATCLPEIYGDAAEYFDPYSRNDIADTLLQIIASKALRTRLTEKGYKRIKQFSWEKMAKETLAAYTTRQ